VVRIGTELVAAVRVDLPVPTGNLYEPGVWRLAFDIALVLLGPKPLELFLKVNAARHLLSRGTVEIGPPLSPNIRKRTQTGVPDKRNSDVSGWGHSRQILGTVGLSAELGQ
jgi:hypothetical protein